MKVTIINQKEKEFEPFEIAILFESQAEVDALYTELGDSYDLNEAFTSSVREAIKPKIVNNHYKKCKKQ